MRRPTLQRRAIACGALAMALTAAAASGATAQTLTDPYPHPLPPRSTANKSTAAKHMKACREFGAGFYRVEGSNTCVKIGGFVEAGVGGHH